MRVKRELAPRSLRNIKKKTNRCLINPFKYHIHNFYNGYCHVRPDYFMVTPFQHTMKSACCGRTKYYSKSQSTVADTVRQNNFNQVFHF